MNDKWKNETCQSCYYRVGISCLESPPTGYEGVWEMSKYPIVKDKSQSKIYSPACSKWKKAKEDL